MFAYCLNNPAVYTDSTGSRAQIWPLLFDDHDPGFIHRMVQDHIVWNGLLFESELYLKGIGRADIYDPGTGEIWEIKHGGSTAQMQDARTQAAINQVDRYTNKFRQVPLRAGHADAFTGSFVLNAGNISYCVTYNTPQPGVILYYVEQMKKYEPAASYAYVSSMSKFKSCALIVAAFSIPCNGGCALDPIQNKHYAN